MREYKFKKINNKIVCEPVWEFMEEIDGKIIMPPITSKYGAKITLIDSKQILSKLNFYFCRYGEEAWKNLDLKKENKKLKEEISTLKQQIKDLQET